MICTGSVIVSVFAVQRFCVPIIEEALDKCFLNHHQPKNGSTGLLIHGNVTHCGNFTGLDWETLKSNLYRKLILTKYFVILGNGR